MAPRISDTCPLLEGEPLIDGEDDEPEVDESLPPGDGQPEYHQPGEDIDESKGPHNARA